MQVEKKRIEDITYQEFIERHWNPGVPLVFSNASQVWKANGTFTPDWFRERFPGRRTTVNGIEYTMREIMDLVEGRDTSRPVPYPCKFHIPGQLPELIEYVTPIDLNYARPNWMESIWFARGNWGNAIELFIGGAGGKFPYIHLDYYHLSAWVTQLYGHKEFTVWPRGQEKFLYPLPNDPWRSGIPDFEKVDPVQYPLYQEATPVKFVVGPGETLFIPFGIWHTAKSLEPTISVAFDLLNGRNFPLFLKDVWGFRKGGNKLKAAAITGYAAFAGMMCRLGDAFGVERASVRS